MKTLAESIREAIDRMSLTLKSDNAQNGLASLQHILSETALGSMATVNDDGSPHINTLFFGNHEMKLFFLSATDSLHCQNISKRPQVAVSIFDTHQDWDKDKLGVQIFGTARISQDESTQDYYSEQIPEFSEYINSQDGQLDEGFEFYEIQITNYKILDEKQFGEENYISN